MGDFFQNGMIATLHNLNQRPLEDLEGDLMRYRKKRPIGLLLPSLYSELEGDALPKIIDELSKVQYLDEIVIGLDQADERQFDKAREFFAKLNQPHSILWNDGPRLKEVWAELAELQLAPREPGKGRNVWGCYGYLLAQGRAKAIALHDCDIVDYDRSLLARLVYPIVHPNFNYKFAKGYYYRAYNGKLNGRVCRLLVTPLIRTLKKVFGQHDFLDYLDSFRYALAGEFAMHSDVVKDIRIPSDWGLEIGILSEVQRNYSYGRICQVDIADAYEHKHQNVAADDRSKGLNKMSIDIASAIFRKLATFGEVFSTETFRTIRATYLRIALDYVELYANDAALNGLRLDRHQEEKMVELFAHNLNVAANQYFDPPTTQHELPFMPSWNRVFSALPEIGSKLVMAVEKDNA